jgi:hypothetical protein
MQQLLRLKNKHSLEQIAEGLVPGGFLGVKSQVGFKERERSNSDISPLNSCLL